MQLLWKTTWRFLKKLKIELPYDLAIPLLGIYPGRKKKLKTLNDTSIPTFIAALFTIANIWKQPKCPSTNKWVKKMWCIYMYIYTHNGILAIKKNEILPFAAMWVDLENIMLSEISQSENDKY